ncbi:hypothetical protein HGRIS_003490 [Hohenbuehelia grisea]|uniref:Uncharacterized protein n=1 Tax=Hohenbuehelia grisea TaxID=104357 RepID=A0ABR3JGJ0_9AGAR
MTLAQRLDELATANSEGLLSDDEYRLLRQNLFERYATGASVPSESSVVPVAKHARGGSVSSATSTQQRPHSVIDPDLLPSRSSHGAPQKPKASVTSSVGSLLRKVTVKRDAHLSPPRFTPAPADLSKDADETPKRGLVSRILSRKSSKLLRVRTDVQASPAAPLLSPVARQDALALPTPPRSPARTTRSHKSSHSGTPSGASPVSLTSAALPNWTIHDVFNDDDLITSADVRREIKNVEAECRGLVDAFNGLEMSTLVRAQSSTMRRLPVATPASPMAIVEGRDWRDYGQLGVSTSTLAHVHLAPTPEREIDGASMRSLESHQSSSPSSSWSTAILGRVKIPRTPQRVPSPLSPNRRPMSARKASMSSLSSRGTASSIPIRPKTSHSTLQVHYTGPNGTLRSSHSANHLPLGSLPERIALSSSESDSPVVESSESGESGPGAQATPKPINSELADIRRRKAEVMRRYEARLEFLRAKLRSLEIHEKLLRR